MRRLERKRAVVTGGTTAIGYSSAERLIAEGATVLIIGAAAVVLMAAAPPNAPPLPGTVQGTNAAVTGLAPGVGAFTYWMNGPDGEVTTLIRASRNDPTHADKDHDFVVRFSTVLAPGQSQTLSVPGIDWGDPPTIRIRRRGDTIEVTSSNTDRGQALSDNGEKSGARSATHAER